MSKETMALPDRRAVTTVSAGVEGVYLTTHSGDYRASVLLRHHEARELAAMLERASHVGEPLHAVTAGRTPRPVCGIEGLVAVTVVHGDVTCPSCLALRGRNDG